MAKLNIMVLCGFVLINLSACSTVNGAGKDIAKAGEWLQDTF